VGVRTRVTLLQRRHGRHVVGSAACISGAPAQRASALSARPARPTMVLGWAVGAKPWVALGPLTVGAKPWVALISRNESKLQNCVEIHRTTTTTTKPFIPKQVGVG
jgi:hypothetical protein